MSSRTAITDQNKGILTGKKPDICWKSTGSDDKTFETSSSLPELLLPMTSFAERAVSTDIEAS